MPKAISNSIVNLGDIGKPADTLVKKVSKAVGGVFAPYQIKRIANAEAEAAIIKAQSDLDIADLQRRAMHRFIEEEARRQINIEEITNRALPQLQENSDASRMEDDWVTNFFDKSRIVSDSEMQDLWARVLAGEANAPGTFAKRTVNFLGDLDKSDAAQFTALCGFGWVVGGLVPLIFDAQGEIYNRHGINFSSLSHLESIGLITFNSLAGFRKLKLPKRFHVFYFSTPLVLEMSKDADNELELGNVMLTKIGQELALICGSKPVQGFPDYVKERWKEHIPQPKAEQDSGSRS